METLGPEKGNYTRAYLKATGRENTSQDMSPSKLTPYILLVFMTGFECKC
jgi:hypothetical protein